VGVRETGIANTANATTTTTVLIEEMVPRAGIEVHLLAAIHLDANTTTMMTVGEMIALIATETANVTVIESAVEIATMIKILARIVTANGIETGNTEMIGIAARDSRLIHPTMIAIVIATVTLVGAGETIR
jgi:hypothetical protein